MAVLRRLRAIIVVAVALTWTGFAAAAGPGERTFNLATATIADINTAMDAGALTSERLVELYLARIAAYDQQGPKLNSLIAVNAAALEFYARRWSKLLERPSHGKVRRTQVSRSRWRLVLTRHRRVRCPG